jgi:hypothetical protein
MCGGRRRLGWHLDAWRVLTRRGVGCCWTGCAQEVCSPFNCDYLLSKGWEVPLSVPRVEPQPVPPFDLQSCAPMRLAPPAGVSGLPTGLAIDPSARTYWILYHDAGRRRHWVVEMRYSGTMLRALELSGLVSPTGTKVPHRCDTIGNTHPGGVHSRVSSTTLQG